METKSWDDILIHEKEENKRLYQQKKDLAEREKNLAARIALLSEQKKSLDDGKSVDAVSRDSKVIALQDKLAALTQQQKELELKLSAAQRKSLPATPEGKKRPASAGAHKQAAPAQAMAQGDPHDARFVINDLKQKILQTNIQIKNLEEEKAMADLDSTLNLYSNNALSNENDLKEFERLKEELKNREAKYILAKSRFDSLDQEYKEYLEKHKELMNQADDVQKQIMDQQKQQRAVEAQIKQLKLRRDHETDLKSILEDMKEELSLLKEENQKLKEDSMSGESIIAQSEVQSKEVVKLQEENETLLQSIKDNQTRAEELKTQLADAKEIQSKLAKEVKAREKEMMEMMKTHESLTNSLREFMQSAEEGKDAADLLHNSSIIPGSSEKPTKAQEEEGALRALEQVMEHVEAKGMRPSTLFTGWDDNSDGFVSQEIFVEGMMALRAGLQREEVRRLFKKYLSNAERSELSEDEFHKMMQDGEEALARKKEAAAGGGEDVNRLKAEIRKLRAVNGQLLQEKDEMFQKLKEADRMRKSTVKSGELESAERLRDLQTRQAAEIRKLEEELSLARYNEKDLERLVEARNLSESHDKTSASLSSKKTNCLILNLSSFKLEEWKDEEPTTFFSIDFFAHETQVTNPVTGLEVSLGWSREFELEVDDVFLEYVERESIILDLMRRTSGEVPFSRMASADVRLAPLMEDAGILNQRLELFGIDGKKLGYVVVNIRMKDSIAPLVASYRRIKDRTSEAASMEAAAFFRHISVPLDQIVLNVIVVRCQGLRSSRYGVLPWPYVQYELPGSGEDPHTTKTVEKEGNPVYEDRRSWRLKSPATAFALRDLELEVFVFDDNETDDLQAFVGLAKVSLAQLFQQDSPKIDGDFRLQDSRGAENGTISLQISWSRSETSSPAPFPVEGSEKKAAPKEASPQDSMKKFFDLISRRGQDHLKSFDEIDAKKDGIIDEDEFMAEMEKHSSSISKSEAKSLFQHMRERRGAIDVASWHLNSLPTLKTAIITANPPEIEGNIVFLLKNLSFNTDLLSVCDLLKFEVEVSRLEDRKQTSRVYETPSRDKSLSTFEKFAIRVGQEQDVVTRLEPIFSQSSTSEVHLTLAVKGVTFDRVLQEKQVLATCRLDLKKLWREGKDREELASPIMDARQHEVGTVRGSLYLMQPLSKIEKLVTKAAEAEQKAAKQSVSSSFSKLKPGTGHIQLQLQQISLQDPSDPAIKEAGANLCVSANFFDLQTAEEEWKQRSSSFDLPQSLHLNHMIEFPIDAEHNESHLNYFVRCLKADEDRDRGAIKVLLLNSPKDGGEEGGEAAKVLAVSQLSIFDLLHLRPEDNQELKCSARLLEPKTSRVMGEVVATLKLQNLNIFNFTSCTFSPHDLERHVGILLKSVALRPSAHVRDVERVSLVVDLEGCASYRSKAVFVKETSVDQKLRERLSLNEKILVDVDKYPLISSKLAAGRRMEVNITLISASDSSVVAELHETSLSLEQDLRDREFELKDKAGQVAAICKIDWLADKAVPAAGKVEVPTSKLGFTLKSLSLESGDQSKSEEVEDVVVELKVVGERVGDYKKAPLKELADSDETLNVDLSDLADTSSQKSWRDLISSKNSQQGNPMTLELIVSSSKGEQAEEMCRGRMEFGDWIAGDVEDREVKVDLKGKDDQGMGQARVSVQCQRALRTVGMRSQERKVEAATEASQYVSWTRKGLRHVLSEGDKSSNLVVTVDSMAFKDGMLSNKFASNKGPVFLSVDLFQDDQLYSKGNDELAMQGTDAYLLQDRMTFGDSFLFPTGEKFVKNRERMLKRKESEELSIECLMYQEPWKAGTTCCARGSVTQKRWKESEGKKIQVELMDGNEVVAVASVEVYYKTCNLV